jgi:hypothetical protein
MSIALEDLAARVRLLEDREELRQLVAQYGPMADSGDAEGASQLWTEDGRYEVVGFGEAKGQAAIAGLLETDEHHRLMREGCAHFLGPVAINVNGDEASARGHSVVFLRQETGFIVYRVAANRWEFRRTEAGWRVTQRSNALLDGAPEARLLLHPQPAS